VTHLTDGMYHVIKIVRLHSKIEFYVDGMEMKLDGGNKNLRSDSQRMFLAQRRIKIGTFKNNSKWNGIIAGLALNHQSIFSSLSHSLKFSGDVEPIHPDPQTGQFTLVDSFFIATAIISTTTTIASTTTTTTSTVSELAIIDNLYHQDESSETNFIVKYPSQTPFEWLYKQLTHFGIRGLLIGAIFSICFLVFLLFLIVHLYCKNRQAKQKLHYQLNSKQIYSPLKPTASHSKFFDCFQSKSKPISSPSFRLQTNGSVVRLNSSDSYHLISSIQESHREQQNLDCCIRPMPLSSTLRSAKKDFDTTSTQTYSAVYSCELATNFDLDQDRPMLKHRIMQKTNQIDYLYMKNLIDCYAIQSNLLATADDNRIQLYQLTTGQFHSQLSVSSVGACHNLLFSRVGQYLIGLFYEVTSNVNPYSVKIWSTVDYSLRTNLHPIKCSIAQASQHLPILYMAGKQKYGRGISLGLLDLDSCSLARELKSDPDTSIGDEIKRILLTKNELYALVACTEYSSSFTCFVIFKLESVPVESTTHFTGSMSNCTMILTRFNCDPKYTFTLDDNDEIILTVLRTNEIILWQLNDGEIRSNYDFNSLLTNSQCQTIVECQIQAHRLISLFSDGSFIIWDLNIPLGQFHLIANLSDPFVKKQIF